MLWRARCFAIFAALAMSGCGRVGVELMDLTAGFRDGGADDAEVGGSDGDGGFDGDAEASTQRDGGALGDGGVVPVPDASASDAAVDARVPACVTGYADCDSDPRTCETQLGTVANCATCGNACPANGGTATCSAAKTCATVCNMSGTFAIKISVTVSWPTSAINGGSGPASLWGRFIGTQSGNNVAGTLQACSIILPDFALNPVVGNELYQLSFPNTLFDHQPFYIPSAPLTLSSMSGFTVGGAFTIPTRAIQIGVSLTNPTTDPWPASAALVASDMDADGKPGVTGLYSNTGGHVFPRNDISGSQRSDRAYAAARFASNASGTVNSCTDMTGTEAFTFFDTHILGCRVSGGADCAAAQVSMMDMGRPAYVAGSSTMHVLKIAAAATCADVRTALP